MFRTSNGRSTRFTMVVLATVLGVGLTGFGMILLVTSAPVEARAQSLAAISAAHSGVEHFRRQYEEDPNCFESPPAASLPCGDGSFRLESADLDRGQWTIVVVGQRGESTHRTTATIGDPIVEIPTGIVIATAHRPTDETLRLGSDSLVASYDPRVGPFGAENVRNTAQVSINGSLKVALMASVFGDVSATGDLVGGDSLSITGSLTESAPQVTADDAGSTVRSFLESSRLSNDNSVLSTVFDSEWTPGSRDENHGDLIVDGGSHVIPSGVYRFRRFEVLDGATVVFDTTAGPSILVYVGSGAGTLDDLVVDAGSSVLIHSGSTTNGLLTVLGADTNLKVTDRSVFGQATGAESHAGYSQIIGMEGARSSSQLTVTDGSRVYARVHATAHRLTLAGDSGWLGSGVIRSLSMDESFFAVDIGPLGTTLKEKQDAHLLAGSDLKPDATRT